MGMLRIMLGEEEEVPTLELNSASILATRTARPHPQFHILLRKSLAASKPSLCNLVHVITLLTPHDI